MPCRNSHIAGHLIHTKIVWLEVRAAIPERQMLLLWMRSRMDLLPLTRVDWLIRQAELASASPQPGPTGSTTYIGYFEHQISMTDLTPLSLSLSLYPLETRLDLMLQQRSLTTIGSRPEPRALHNGILCRDVV